jgi:hypothetical protein
MPKESTLEDYKAASTSRFKCTAFLGQQRRQQFLGSATGAAVVRGSLAEIDSARDLTVRAPGAVMWCA